MGDWRFGGRGLDCLRLLRFDDLAILLGGFCGQLFRSLVFCELGFLPLFLDRFLFFMLFMNLARNLSGFLRLFLGQLVAGNGIGGRDSL